MLVKKKPLFFFSEYDQRVSRIIPEDGVYFGGLLVCLYNDWGLRTLYITDVGYGWEINWDRIRVHLSFAYMNLHDSDFDEDDYSDTDFDVVNGRFYASRIDNVDELRELVALCHEDVYHVVNADWDFELGWYMHRTNSIDQCNIANQTEKELTDCIFQTEKISELVGYALEGVKSNNELAEYISTSGIEKALWFVSADLRKYDRM